MTNSHPAFVAAIRHSGFVIDSSFGLRPSSFTGMHFTDLAIQIIADDKIRSAIERGEFDRLPGLGRPHYFDLSDDPDWWIRRKLSDEGITCVTIPRVNLELR
jgi:hypothetical protein